jgi:hypothetical protein
MHRATLAVLAAVTLQSCAKKAEPTPAVQAPVPVRAKVTVLNADVLVIDGKHYSLANGQAPQPAPDAHCWAEALAAKLVTRVVSAMVARAGNVDATPTGAKDTYGREVATVHLDGADLGELLFKDGMVARPAKGRFEWCDPVSRGGEGSPSVLSMMEITPGSTTAH